MPMKPALLPQEWGVVRAYEKLFPGKNTLPSYATACIINGDFHGLAALALHGQEFGFTREDVKTLEENLTIARDALCGFGEDGPARRLRKRTESLAARIAALLPPEDANVVP